MMIWRMAVNVAAVAMLAAGLQGLTPLTIHGRPAAAQDRIDWPMLLQQPYEKLSLQDLGSKPLLVDDTVKMITDKAGWEKQRQALMKAWRERLGEPPAPSPALDVKSESVEQLEDHARELLSFASEGEDRIRAYLLKPRDLREGEKRPAVVVFHQTTKDTLKEPVGLGAKPELALALHLVRRGYIALSPECYIMKASGPKAQADAVARRRPDWTGLGKMTFDASRCVDLLESLPQVDKARIGCIGHSLGAKEVLYALAFEPRYKAGVFSEGGIGLRMSNWTDPWYLTEKMKPHIPALENHQVMALIAPRPFLIIGGESADGKASWTFVSAVRPVYELLGARERIGLHLHDKGHAFPAEARELAYRWLDHWLDWKVKN
jgi:dienelactone hydrolase